MPEARGVGIETESKVRDRVEADVVRLEATRLPSGLYRHRLVKFIFELGRQQQDGRLPE